MSDPVISVIIPAYNAQEYLRECLESVLAQSFQDFEVIIVNDGSTDGTLAIADQFAARDHRMRVLTTTNQGLACARNNGIDSSKGAWLTFLDSDDKMSPTALESLLSAALHHRCGIVKGTWSRNADRNNSVHRDFGTVLSPDRAIESVLYQTMSQPSACASLYRRELFEYVRFTPKIWYEDLDFFYRIFLKSDNVAFIPDIVYFYRDNPASFINRFSPGRLDVLSVTETIENYMRQNKPQLLSAARDRRLSANFNMFALLMLKTSAAEYVDQKRGCWSIIKAYRRECLMNPKTRLKNKLGSLLSCLGRKPFVAVARFIYR